MREQITISLPRQRIDHGWPTIEATISLPDRSYDIFYRSSRGPLTANADPFLPVALLPAMRLNAPLVVEGAVSPLLLRRIDRIQDIFARWHAHLHKVAVTAAVQNRPTIPTRRGIASFYSGGIDSSYTVLKHRDELTDLIFVHGFDLPLAKTELRQSIAGVLHGAAAGFGKTMIEVETNLRDLVDAYVEWRLHAAGPALGAVALVLAPQFSRVYWGSGAAYESLQPVSYHPLLDPLWGTEDLEIEHDGCERARLEKADEVIDNPIVQRCLRTCWHQEHGKYNCGQCEGCLVVMAYLRAKGVAEQCPTYPRLDDLGHIREFRIKNYYAVDQLERILGVAERAGRDPDLIQALRERLERPDARSFDRNRTNELSRALAHIEDLQLTRARVEQRAAALTAELQACRQEASARAAGLERLEKSLYTLTSSQSWKLTAPLRAAIASARALRRRSRRRSQG